MYDRYIICGIMCVYGPFFHKLKFLINIDELFLLIIQIAIPL